MKISEKQKDYIFQLLFKELNMNLGKNEAKCSSIIELATDLELLDRHLRVLREVHDA